MGGGGLAEIRSLSRHRPKIGLVTLIEPGARTFARFAVGVRRSNRILLRLRGSGCVRRSIRRRRARLRGLGASSLRSQKQWNNCDGNQYFEWKLNTHEICP
jgi:hypothetical protein